MIAVMPYSAVACCPLFRMSYTSDLREYKISTRRMRCSLALVWQHAVVHSQHAVIHSLDLLLCERRVQFCGVAAIIPDVIKRLKRPKQLSFPTAWVRIVTIHSLPEAQTFCDVNGEYNSVMLLQ